MPQSSAVLERILDISQKLKVSDPGKKVAPRTGSGVKTLTPNRISDALTRSRFNAYLTSNTDRRFLRGVEEKCPVASYVRSYFTDHGYKINSVEVEGSGTITVSTPHGTVKLDGFKTPQWVRTIISYVDYGVSPNQINVDTPLLTTGITAGAVAKYMEKVR